MRASSPACSVHAMDAAALERENARLFAIFDHETPVAMGAIKKINGLHGELKSMHVAEAERGRGLGMAMLGHLLVIAREMAFSRVSLETGSQPAFARARELYGAAGFAECPPFEGYVADPNSVFMTRTL